MLPYNMVTPHSSPEKGSDQSSVMYPRSSVMYTRGTKTQPRTWTPPCNTSRTRTPETSRAAANKYSNSRLGLKRKCASEGCLSSKCYIREISKGLDKMIIKVKTPPPSPDNFPMGWSMSSCDSDNTMQCFPHSFMKHKSKQGTSPPSSLSHLQSRDALQFPETNFPPQQNPSRSARFHHSPVVGYGTSASPAMSNCSRTLWSVQEDGDHDDDENGFRLGMDYTVNASPVKNRFASEAYQQHDEKFVPKRVIQLRGENGIRAGMFVRDPVYFKRSGK